MVTMVNNQCWAKITKIYLDKDKTLYNWIKKIQILNFNYLPMLFFFK